MKTLSKTIVSLGALTLAACHVGHPAPFDPCEMAVEHMYEQARCTFSEGNGDPVDMLRGIEICKYTQERAGTSCEKEFLDWTDCLEHLMPGQCHSCNDEVSKVYACTFSQ